MGLSLTTVYTRANELLKFTDFTTLSQTDRENIISNLVAKEYSKKRPLLQIYAYTGTSDNWYSLPSDFEDGFSVISEIEYPIESTPKMIIAPKYYSIDIMSGGKVLRFDYGNPGASNVFWMKYTKRHIFDSSGASEIPEADEDAFTYLAVALMCKALADKFGEKADSNLPNVDFVTYESRVQEWTGNYRDWLKRYNELMVDNITGVHGQIDFSQDMYFDRNAE